jgi:hypothetical protein
MEKYCPNCHRPNTSDAEFCRHCATPLSGASGRPQPENVNQPPQRPNAPQNQPPPNFGGGQQNFSNGANGGESSSKGLISVILVAVGLLLCCGPLTGVPAAILGWMEMTAIKEGRSPKDGMWMAQVGLWGGIVVSILGAVGGFFFLLLSAASGSGY